jgi:hypothetical protein
MSRNPCFLSKAVRPVLVNTVLTLAGKEEPRRIRTCLTLPNMKQTSSQRKENRKSNKRKTVTMISPLLLLKPARHLWNRRPGNKDYHWHYDEFTRSSEIQWNS